MITASNPAPHPANVASGMEARRTTGRYVTVKSDRGGIEQRFILHDRDTRFSEEFDSMFRDEDIKVVKTPFEAPDANAFAESWIGNFKRECLNHLYCFSLAHVDFVARQALECYNNYRPHQSRENKPLRFPGERPAPRPVAKGDVKCRQFLGGLMRHYYRKAA